MIERIGLVLLGLVLAGCIYWLANRVQLLLNYAEQLLGALGIRVAEVPGKSAPRTDGSGLQPHTWWQRLRRLDDAPDAPLDDLLTPTRAPTPWPRTDTAAAPAVTDFAPTPPAAEDPWVAQQMTEILAKLHAPTDSAPAETPAPKTPRKRTRSTP